MKILFLMFLGFVVIVGSVWGYVAYKLADDEKKRGRVK